MYIQVLKLKMGKSSWENTKIVIKRKLHDKNSHKTEQKFTKTFSVPPPPPPAFCGLQEQLFAYLLPKREKRGEQLRSQNTMTRCGGLYKDAKL